MGLVNKLFRGDRSVWIIFMFLCLVSLVEVYSATSTLAYKNVYFFSPIVRHATFLICGFAAVLLLHNIPSKYYSVAIVLLPISMIMLLATLLIGVSINDANRFLSFFGIQFQPSEIAKLSCVVFVAFMLSKQDKFTPNKTFWITIIGVGLTCMLIFTENFSTAFLLFVVCFLMMFVGQAPLKKMGILLAILILCGMFVFSAFHTVPDDFARKYFPDRYFTWRARFGITQVEEWKSPVEIFKKDNKKEKENKYVLNDDNFQVVHAKIAIAKGSVIGKMPGRSDQRDFLPQAYSDFIYAIIIEELGLIFGGIGVMMLYVFLMFRVAIIARRCEKLFPKYLALGCGLLIVIQAFINMAVAVNLIPVTGQPLPLISRGGTSTMLTCLYFGFILSVSRFGAGMGDEVDDIEDDIANTDDAEIVNEDKGFVAEYADIVDDKDNSGK